MFALTTKSYREEGREMYDMVDFMMAYIDTVLAHCEKFYINDVWLVRFMKMRSFFIYFFFLEHALHGHMTSKSTT